MTLTDFGIVLITVTIWCEIWDLAFRSWPLCKVADWADAFGGRLAYKIASRSKKQHWDGFR